MKKSERLYNKTDKKLQRISSTVGAIMAIIGAAAGVCSWVSHQFANFISNQINDFQQEMRESTTENKQAVTRVELMILMEHDPENVVAIEQMAKYYFSELHGDKYMTGKYSAWAKQHGGDMTIVIGGK